VSSVITTFMHVERSRLGTRGGTRPPQPLIIAFIDTMRSEGHAVESICKVLREQEGLRGSRWC